MDYYSVSDEYNKLQNGSAKMEAIKKFINAADLEKNYECAVRFRYDYIKQAVFYDDVFKAFVILPEYLKIFDEHYDEIDYNRKDIIMLYPYIWLIPDSTKFYQISNETVKKYLEDFKRRLIERGHSLKSYYLCLADYIEDIDEDEYIKAFQKYLNTPRDSLLDGEKSEMFNTINFELFHGSYEKAMKLAKPILDNKIKYGDWFEYLCANIISYHIKNNIVKENIEELSSYKDILYKEMSKSISSLTFVNTIIKYCIIVDLDEGLRLFKKHLNWDSKVKTPSAKFNFELAAYRLFRAIKEKQNRKTIKLNLDENFKLYKEDGTYLIDDLINYFKNDITYIAKKFDEKNKNNDYMKSIADDSFLL